MDLSCATYSAISGSLVSSNTSAYYISDVVDVSVQWNLPFPDPSQQNHVNTITVEEEYINHLEIPRHYDTNTASYS